MSEAGVHIVFAERFDAGAVEKARAVGRVSVLDSCDEGTLLRAVVDCDALVVRTRAEVTRAVIAAAPRLRVIGRGGVGLENIDLAAAAERNVQVVYTPAASTDAVADLAVGLMIGLVRGIPFGDAAVRAGRFYEAREQFVWPELSELTLGIVGLGRIGRAVAQRCRQGFGMRILYNDIVSPGWTDFTATAVEKDELYRESDVVTLHVPLTDLTRSLIDAAALRRFKRGAYLINTARGAVVDHFALAEALHQGALGGAALDVVDPEPLPDGHPLFLAPSVIFTPHVGARSPGAVSRMNAVVEDVLRALSGKDPLYAAPCSGAG
ncbi:MAG: NAD(P)-dependent oxidoreductase [Planctomycetota bacterium]